MAVNTSYGILGNKLIVPQADLLNLVSPANTHGDTRLGGNAIGKVAGMEVLCKLTSGSTLNSAFALGPKSSDAWRIVDGSANYTPVNISTWTVSTGCDYTAGLLTADGTDNPTATQVIALNAGTYKYSLKAAGEGTYSADYHTAKITITGETDGAYLTKVFNSAKDVTVSAATGAEAATSKTPLVGTFTLTADQDVTISLSVVNEDGDLEAGSAYILLDALEAG